MTRQSVPQQAPPGESGQEADRRPPPVETIRMGGVKASVWENHTRNGPVLSVTLVRTYWDGQAFRDTKSFRRDDLLVAAEACRHAFNWVVEYERQLQEAQKQAAGQQQR